MNHSLGIPAQLKTRGVVSELKERAGHGCSSPLAFKLLPVVHITPSSIQKSSSSPKNHSYAKKKKIESQTSPLASLCTQIQREDSQGSPCPANSKYLPQSLKRNTKKNGVKWLRQDFKKCSGWIQKYQHQTYKQVRFDYLWLSSFRIRFFLSPSFLFFSPRVW